MCRLLQVLLLAMVILQAECQPSCTFDDNTAITTCVSGDEDYILNKGLVSDNNRTSSIVLRSCRITKVNLDAFHGLYRLRNLDLSANKIRQFESGVFDEIRDITHLNLTYNMLTELPMGLFDKQLKLQLLDLKGNSLNSFFPSGIFDQLSSLGYLDISSNAFYGRHLDPHLFDKTMFITFMDFSGSDMTDTPDNLLHAFRIIDFLNLSGCSLTEVPLFATAQNLKTMLHLKLVNNEIKKIDEPATFRNLINLEKLTLSGNPIEMLHPDIFKPLRKIRSIVIYDNNLKEIPDTLFTGLEKLTNVDLSNNKIEFVPVNAFRGTRLRNLNLSNNKFTYLTDNFVLELRNSGAMLSKFYFNKNPLQCACLRDILKEMKFFKVEYNSFDYDGKHKACVTQNQFTCQRNQNLNSQFVDLYKNSYVVV